MSLDSGAQAFGRRLRQGRETRAELERVIREGRGSTSLLQRGLGIGYGRAARIIDYMAEDGIVGEFKNGSAREVLYTWKGWEAMKNGGDSGEVEPEISGRGCRRGRRPTPSGED
jgi:S-DNA-T family DNA segregation ATPase FtsK/SpoIIIE